MFFQKQSQNHMGETHVNPFASISLNHICFCNKSTLHQVMPYLLVVLNKVSQLFTIETTNFCNVPWLFFVGALLFLVGFLSHFIFWPFFGLLVLCTALPIFTSMSCDTCSVPTFLCMESSFMHSMTIISQQVTKTSFCYNMAF
jgi:hypothetical protein